MGALFILAVVLPARLFSFWLQLFEFMLSLRPGSYRVLARLSRSSSTTAQARHDPSKLRNMALVAHIDSGKTTLTESILHSSSYLAAAGSVDTGSTTTDFLPAERERGITIQSASIPVQWQDWTFNLIDTPGHADFGMEVESASRVVDGAVVLMDSVEGVEAQTKGVWKQLDRYGVSSRIMFMNKLDRPGASFHNSLLSLLSHRLHPAPMPLTVPIASFEAGDYARAEPGIQGLIDLVKWEVWKWDRDMECSRHPLGRSSDELLCSNLFSKDHPLLPHLADARSQLLENLSMFSEPLMEHLLALPGGTDSYLQVNSKDIIPHLRSATLQNQILPVICGSAFKHIGTEVLMDYVGALLPSPLDKPHEKQDRDAPLQMLAWKVTWDRQKGWMTFVRLYSGKLTSQSTILNTTRGKKEKANKLMLLYANEAKEVSELPFGSVGVILGLKYTRTGDTLSAGRTRTSSALPNITPPPPLMAASIVPETRSDLEPMQEALEALCRTDPSVRVDSQEGQILIHGLGALHLEIVEGRLRNEWNAKFELGKRRVSYRETLKERPVVTFNETWKADSGVVSLELAVRRLNEDEAGDSSWGGNLVVGEARAPYVSPEASLETPSSYIARGLSTALSSSVNSSLPISHAHIQVLGHDCPAGVPISSLTPASTIILRNILKKIGMGPLMEPFIHLKLTVDEASLGRVVKDLTENGGEVLDLGTGAEVMSSSGEDEQEAYPTNGVYVPPAWMSPSSSQSLQGADSPLRARRVVRAIAPLSKLLDYNTKLRALSGGHGTFEMTSAGFRQVTDSRGVEILKEIGKAM